MKKAKDYQRFFVESLKKLGASEITPSFEFDSEEEMEEYGVEYQLFIIDSRFYDRAGVIYGFIYFHHHLVIHHNKSLAKMVSRGFSYVTGYIYNPEKRS